MPASVLVASEHSISTVVKGPMRSRRAGAFMIGLKECASLDQYRLLDEYEIANALIEH
jgi:hypothetical protein